MDQSRNGTSEPSPQQIRKIEGRFGDDVRELFDIKPSALTESEAAYILNFRDADALRATVAKAGRDRSSRLAGRTGGSESAPLGSDPTLRKYQQQPDTFAAEFLSELAQVDDMFLYPRAASRNLDGVFSEIAPEADYKGQMSPDDMLADDPDAEKHLVTMPSGQPFFVYRTEDEVWFDVSRLSEGEAGNALYAAMGDYALNSGRKFIGDSAGLSEVALPRRTEAMLSSAIKHGTTEHLAPHEYQLHGDENLGAPPLRWREGDHLGKMLILIEVSVESLAHHVPEFRRARYDFGTATFRDSQGAAIPDEKLREWASQHPRVRAARAGSRTLKRGILLNTLARAESSQRPGLLEQVLRQPGKLVGDSLASTFYRQDRVLDEQKERTLLPDLRKRLDKLMIRGVDLRFAADDAGAGRD